jgi:hypothetical protein
MSEEHFSTLSVVNHYQDGKLTGYSVGDGEVVSLAKEEPLPEPPELFPIRPEYQKPKTKEGNEPPCWKDMFPPRKDRE